VYASVAAADAGTPKADVERGKQLATTVCAAATAPGQSTAPANPNLAGQHGGYIALQLARSSRRRPSPIMQGMAAGFRRKTCATWAPTTNSRSRPRAGRDKALVAARRADLARRHQGRRCRCAGPRRRGTGSRAIPAPHGNIRPAHGLAKAYAWCAANAVMGPIASRLNDNDMKAVVEYIAALR
jgi:cytochrome c553